MSKTTGVGRLLLARRGATRLVALAGLVLFVAGGAPAQNLSTSPNGFGMRASGQSGSVDGENSLTLTALKFSETSVVGGESTTITLSLADPAPAAGARISLSSSDPTVVLTPASVRVEGGETSLSFPISTYAIAAAESITVRAQYGAATVNADLSVFPATAAPFTLAVHPASVTLEQGKSGSATVTSKVDSGFDHSLQVKASGEPAGVKLTLNPKVIPAPGSGTSRLSISVGSSVPAGSYPLTITSIEGSDSASARTTLKVISSSGNPNAKFKGCWYKQSGHSYQAVDFSLGNPGTYPFNAILYYGTTCNANDVADQIGFGELVDFGAVGWTFWFSAFADQTDMSALWYVGEDSSQCVNYETAPDC
ncbi:MAG: hypothetical protein WBW38_07480 [Candidatus Sulfotelmatobacter sp.]